MIAVEVETKIVISVKKDNLEQSDLLTRPGGFTSRRRLV
jgi:hypothetical protein